MPDIINLEHVFKRIGRREILKDVSVMVKRGDIFGYLGPNGAGKTTTIRIILGLMDSTSGKVSVLGQDTRTEKIRRKIGFVLETDGLYDNMSGYENLAYYAQLYDVPQPKEKIEKAVRLVELSDRAKDKVGAYSEGMRQRLALARAIVPDPDVLVLDEPTSGVDPTGQVEIRQIMLNMIHNEGKTILLSSHNLDEVQRICNRIALIHKGQIRLSGELERLQHEMSHGAVVIETTEEVGDPVITEITSLPGVNLRDRQDRVLNLVIGKGVGVPYLVNLLVSKGVGIEQVVKQEASLEEIYTTIVKEAEQ